MEWPIDMNLKIGDYVILKHVKPIEGCLGTDGISNEEVILDKQVDEIEHSLWQIHVQNQYSAMKEYEEFYYLNMYEQHGDIDPFDDEDKSDVNDDESDTADEVSAMLMQLRRAAANESTLNKKLMAMKLGKPLQFGDVFQLCHVQSKKMLTVNSTVLAKHERENIRISLHPQGDAMSWFELIPRSKNDREGQLVYNNAEAYIRVHERPSEFVHAARKPHRDNENIREINCSLETSCWNVCIYQEASSLRSSTISAGQLITFQEPETSTYLSVGVKERKVDQDQQNENFQVTEEDDTKLILSTDTPMAYSASGGCTIGTNLLWQIEKENRQIGGTINSRFDRVSFRHLNSGLYLNLQRDSLTVVKSRNGASFFDIYPTSQNSTDVKNLVQNNTTVQLGEFGRWMRLPSLLLSGPTLKSRMAMNMLPEVGAGHMTSEHSTSSLHEEEGFIAVDRNSATPLQLSSNIFQVIGVDLYVGVQATQFLQQFVESIKERTLIGDSLANVERIVKTLFGVLNNVLDFITDDMKCYSNEDNVVFGFDDVVKGDAKNKVLKQTMMREQGVLTEILNIIDLCGRGDLEHLPNSIRRRHRRGRGKQSTPQAGMLKSPSARKLIKATSTFKTLVSQLSDDQGSKEQTVNAMTNKIKRINSRQGSMLSSLSKHDPDGFSSPNSKLPHRKKSLFGLKSMQKTPNDKPPPLSEKSHSQMFKQRSFNESANYSENYDNFEDLQSIVKGLRSISHDISVACFRTLLAIIEDNHANQMFIADKFPVLLHQIRDHSLAVTCVQEMLHDNLQMLQTKVRQREIAIFLDLLEESEMNVTLLQLLRSTCSCPMGIDSTQCMVAKALLDDCAEVDVEESKDSLADNTVPVLQLPDPKKKLSVMKIDMLTRLGDRVNTKRSSHDYSKLLIRVEQSPVAKEKDITWPNKSIYLPDDPLLYSTISGFHLVHEGVPRMYVNWSCTQGHAFSMRSLFGFSKDVPYEYLCNIARHDNSRSKRKKEALPLHFPDANESSVVVSRTASLTTPDSNASSRKITMGRKKTKRNTTVMGNNNRLSISSALKTSNTDMTLTRKLQVVDYFCAQLCLMADLCLDRNYVAMKLVEAAFPYDMLIGMLKIPNSSQRCKAPVCRLLRCLYVDREPQSEAKFPRLIRTSVSLSGGDENAFQDHHEGSPYKFSILQQIISDYIHNELDATNCDELSAEMLDLLLSLIKFGYYNSLAHLQDVIVPLTKALGDHRSVSKAKARRGIENSESPDGSEEQALTAERRNAMPLNIKASELQPLQAPSLASSLFGVAPSSPLKKLNRNDSEEESKSAKFWESFRKLGKSSVSPDGDDYAPEETNHRLSGRMSQVWSKFLAPLAFMSGARGSQPAADTVSEHDFKVKNGFFASDIDDDKGGDKKISHRNVKRQGTKSNNGKHKSNHSQSWEEKALQFSESLYFVAFFVFLVLASTAVAIIDVASIDVPFFTRKRTVTFVVDLVFTVVFLLEVATRMYCTQKTQNEILSFLTKPLNFMDVFIVVLDVFVLLMDWLLEGQTSYVTAARFLKVLRMFRIIRIVRAARLINTIASSSYYRHEPYVVPERYSNITEMEVRTITGIIKIVSAVHDRIQDRKLGLFIQYFSDWFNDSIMNAAKDPKEVYAQICADTGMINAFPPKFDAMLVDVVMYNDPKLADDALQLLMVHESQEEFFLSTAKQVQIIYSAKLERLYRSFLTDLKKLKNLAEAYELWGGAVCDGSDLGPAKNIVDMLEDLSVHLTIKSESTTIESGPSSEPDREVQQLLFNLDAMSIFMTIERSILDGQIDEPVEMIKTLIKACNETIILYLSGNQVNQVAAFVYFNWFYDRIDDSVGSSRVAKAMIAGNRSLMKQCPKTMLSDLMKKIVSKGRKPEYLDLLVGMTEIIDDGDSGVIALRNEISRSVTNRDRVKFLIEWCDPPGTPGYEERKAAMAPFAGKNKIFSREDLPMQLQYHINMLTLLSGLKLGQKLQAIYAIEDIIAAILDVDTIFNVRRCLGVLLEELVENRIDGIESSECIWEFLKYCEKMFDDMLTDLPTLLSRDQFLLRFQNAEWIKTILMIIVHFFDNFDFLVFRETAFDSDSAFKVTESSEEDIQLVIFNLHHSIKSIRESHGRLLGSKLTSTFEEALMSLSHLIVQVNTEKVSAPQGRRSSLVGARRGDMGQGRNRADELHEAFYRKQYLTFLSSLRDDHSVHNNQAMKIFEKLPSVKDSVESDVRLEYFLIKISSHIRSRFNSSGAVKSLDSGVVTVAKWVLDTWTHLIQKEIGQISLNDLADPQKVVVLPQYTRFQEILNSCGATVLCLDLIAVNVDHALVNGALKLLVVLLSGSGGNVTVQQTIYEFLFETDSVTFFEEIKDLLEQQMMWCQRKSEMKSSSENADEMPESILCLKVLSAMCDNCCMNNKNVVREQSGNSRVVNLLDSLASYVDLLSRLEDHSCIKICARVLHTILCVVQGPCKGNQEHFVLHTNLLSALNRIMRLSQSSIQLRSHEWASDVEMLKVLAFDLLHACIEGQHAGSVVLERIQVAMELNVLNVLIIPSEVDEFGDVIELSELSDLQATYLVFLQNLSNCNDSVEIPLNAQCKIQSDVARIEVVWNKEVAVHYFNIPPIALDITGHSKEHLVEHVDLSSQEAKLKDFLKRAKDLYSEAVHFQHLKSWGFIEIWNFKHKLFWIMLSNVLVMNVLMLTYYKTDEDDDIRLPDNVGLAIFVMNAFHVVFAVGTLSTYIIVRVPVLYRSFLDKGNGLLVACLKTLTHRMTMWHTVYLCVSVLSILKSYLFLSILLLDFIVVDSTSRDVMNAVIYPARQLATALIIIMIMVNIFSGAVFFFFRHDFDLDNVYGETLFDTFKLLITFGVRANEGVGAYMTPNIHTRFILDMFFFLIIVVILMNIFFGIIIDTFGKLRNLKVEREADEANKCFICGVEEHNFMKQSKRIGDNRTNESFKHHRQATHYMWNYLYFAMKIWQQPRDLDNSVEMHVRSCMDRGDVSWFPIGIYSADSDNNSLLDDAPVLQAGNMSSDNGDRGGTPSSPRGKRGDENETRILHDFARLEESFTQKLNTFGDNIATLAACSAQNTFDENTILSDHVLSSSARGNAGINGKFRESVMSSSSKPVSGSSKIQDVADKLRVAMSEAVANRKEAQRQLADLVENTNSLNIDENARRSLRVETGELMNHQANIEQDEEVEVLQENGKDTVAPPTIKMVTSPSTRMMEMMRLCFQQELAPLKMQMDDLTNRVGQLENFTITKKGDQNDPTPEQNISSVEDDIELKKLHDANRTILSPLNKSSGDRKSSSIQQHESDADKATKVRFRDVVSPYTRDTNPVLQIKASADQPHRKIFGKVKSSLKADSNEKSAKHDNKKAELKHVYIDSAKPRVKSAPSTRKRLESIEPAVTVNSSSAPSKMESDRLQKVHVASVELSKLKEDATVEDEITAPSSTS